MCVQYMLRNAKGELKQDNEYGWACSMQKGG